MTFLKYWTLYIILTFSINTAFSQKQANIWYFGNKAGLDFNFTPPVPLNNGKAGSFEGTAVMSDNNGKLLFYTNGQVIMNKRHLLMKNGGALRGDLSSTNNTVIVPLPGNDSLFYVFTTGAALQDEQFFQYNVVNMKGDGGLGEVIGMNIMIEYRIFEKIAAVRHCNNRDVWILIRAWNSDEYHAYLLTASGLNTTPVISHTGLFISGFENNAIGTLKFSAKGDKLAAIHSFQNDQVELMDFDKNTGILSNPITFKPNAVPHVPAFTGIYGAEFSPSGRLLYVSANNSSTEAAVVYQFDISSHNPATILASKQLIHTNNNWYGGALQTGPDQKIYMAMWKDTSVSVIENPDISGPGCNFRYNKIYMGSLAAEPVQFGLPTFVQSYFDTTSNPYDFSRNGNCSDHNVRFTINRLSGIDSVKWFFGDGNTSQSLSPVNFYVNSGFYTVKLIVYKVDCSGLNDTISRSVWITDNTQFLGPDTASCAILKLVLGIDEVNGANYLWNNDSLTNRITSSGAGTYWLQIEQNGCSIRDSVNIALLPPPVVNIGPDTSLCKFQSVTLDAAQAFGDSYLWSTGETAPSIQVRDIGTYHVKVTRNGCIASDTLSVGWGDCSIFIPSAFTPNGDGKNDQFGLLNGTTLKNFFFEVFDKWGQPMFITKDVSEKWDGTHKKARMPNGTYVWILHYVNLKNERKFLNGTVMLIR
ncbi:MAG: gliding motility-associated C-terminal domain-containing protein [Chitinophagaceae bacterium]|nr:gliding motility-associated C-terminal domain-containing protein [Chitinophagaceae bacterium]